MSGSIPEISKGWLVFLDMEDERPDAWFANEEAAFKFLDLAGGSEFGDVLPALADFELSFENSLEKRLTNFQEYANIHPSNKNVRKKKE